MKTIFKTYLALLSIVLIAFSCDDDTNHTTINPNASTTASLSTTSVVLSKDSETETAAIVSWTAPELGFDSAAPTYRLLLDVAGGDFSSPESFTEVSAVTDTLTHQTLNTKLLNLGLEPGVETTVDIVVQVILSNVNSLYSEPVTLTVTPYAAILDLSTTWGIVGSAAPNGWNGPDAPFYQTGTDDVYVAYVTLTDGEIKFRENNAWDLNYGDTGVDGTLDAGGDNIAVTAGTYKITFDLNNLTYEMEIYSWGITGSAAPNDWAGPDAILEYDPTSDQWRALVTLADGEIKFRTNNAWTLDYGDTDADGTLDQGGTNIAVTAGNYLITANFNDLTYTLEAIDFWGIVGSATPNAWDGPDIALKLDYSSDGMVWYNDSFDLTDGEIKFRTNSTWTLDYGDTDADGTLNQGGTNIAVTAGNYAVSINLEDLTYTLEEN
ncbi:MAG: SusE domain-containing protein [Flavobacteriaceae bacterium]